MNQPDLHRDSTALVVIDMQERLAMAMEPAAFVAAADNTRRLIAAAKILHLPVIVTEQYPAGLGPTVAALRDELVGTGTPMEKLEFAASKNTAFMQRLGMLACKSIVIAGMEAHICVLQTALGLAATHDVWVAHDAVVSRSNDNRAQALELMRARGVTVAPTESILFWLLERAGSPEFKAVSKLIR